jgi:hypothetical protein
MTLIELVVVIALVGLVVSVISAAIVVTVRQAPVLNDRVETARWEQNLGTWLPADLTSADIPPELIVHEDGSTEPNPEYYDPSDPAYAGPAGCPASMCAAGVNVLHLEWREGADDVVVTYRYVPSETGVGSDLIRVECRNAACSSIPMVRGMADVDGGPPIVATTPPGIPYVDPNGSPAVNTAGRSVSITLAGAEGVKTLTFSGGGAELVNLKPAAIQPPQFLLARSGCGGPITLIVDESTSLSSADIANVKAGVRSFVQTFAGTPTRLQVITMAGTAQVLGAGSAWNRWYDLSEPTVVSSLLGGSSPINSEIAPRSATNWEDALYRAFYAQNGQTYQFNGNPAAPAPELVVFFTDGLPTYDRLDDHTGPTTPAGPNPAANSAFDGVWDNDEITQFSPRSWQKAQWIVQQNSTIPIIGVGVGQALDDSTDLFRDTTLSTTSSPARGVYLWAATRTGSGTSGNPYRKWIPAQLLLGDLIAGGNPATWTTGTPLSTRFKGVAWSASEPSNGGWGDISEADILTTTDFTRFGSALEQIALGECGGTLTIQTRLDTSGSPPVGAMVTYEVSGADHPLTESTTSAVAKTGVFDIATDGAAEEQVLLRPRPLTGSGYNPSRWECRSRNVVVTDPDKVSANGATAADGINVVVSANEALSCILYVVPA